MCREWRGHCHSACFVGSDVIHHHARQCKRLSVGFASVQTLRPLGSHQADRQHRQIYSRHFIVRSRNAKQLTPAPTLIMERKKNHVQFLRKSRLCVFTSYTSNLNSSQSPTNSLLPSHLHPTQSYLLRRSPTSGSHDSPQTPTQLTAFSAFYSLFHYIACLAARSQTHHSLIHNREWSGGSAVLESIGTERVSLTHSQPWRNWPLEKDHGAVGV